MVIETWNHRHMRMQQERDLTLTVEEYYTWQWNIMRRYVLRAKEHPIAMNPYTTRVSLERNVVCKVIG